MLIYLPLQVDEVVQVEYTFIPITKCIWYSTVNQPAHHQPQHFFIINFIFIIINLLIIGPIIIIIEIILYY